MNALPPTRRDFLAVIGLGLPALALFGCHPKGSTPPPLPSSDNPDLPDAGFPEVTDAGSPQGPDAARSTDANSLPSFRVDRQFATIPCRYPSSLALLSGSTVLIGTCVPGGTQPGDQNSIFGINTSDSQRPIPATSQPGFPAASGDSLNYYFPLSPSRGVVTSALGLYEVSPAGVTFIPFPDGIALGGGMVFSQGKLFVPAANFDGISYNPGELLVYDLNSSGQIQAGSLRRTNTSGLNPTGVARQNTNLLVLNSGSPLGNTRASLDRVDMATERIVQTIPLGPLGAQLCGEIALTPDGSEAVIGTSDDSGRLLFVNLASGSVTVQNLPGSRFHSSLQMNPVRGWLYVTDFNSGTVSVIGRNRSLLGTLPLVANGGAGPSRLVGEVLVQAVPYGAVGVYPM